MQKHQLRNFSRDLRKNMTMAERRLWNALRGRAVERFKFNRQVVIGPFIVDFLCKQQGLIIEVDGATHVDDLDKWRDEKRDAYLVKLGYEVLRIRNEDVFDNLAWVVDNIEKRLRNRPSRFSSPARWGSTAEGGDGVLELDSTTQTSEPRSKMNQDLQQ